MNPPRVPPTPAESVEIRATAEIAALSALPGIIAPPSLVGGARVDGGLDLLRKAFLGMDGQQQRENVRELFDLLGRKECNKHLLMFLVDLVVVRLVPELAERTPKELFDLRTGELY